LSCSAYITKTKPVLLETEKLASFETNKWEKKIKPAGFEYRDDGFDEEEIEERIAKPENQNQQDLIAFFDGDQDVSESIMAMFITEKNAEHPNFPLFRKYFGYEALLALQDIFEPGTDKRKIVDYLITEEDETDDSMIPM